MSRDDDFRAALVEIGHNVVAVESHTGEWRAEFMPLISGATPTVSKRCNGSDSNRTRLPKASVKASILVVILPIDQLTVRIGIDKQAVATVDDLGQLQAQCLTEVFILRVEGKTHRRVEAISENNGKTGN